MPNRILRTKSRVLSEKWHVIRLWIEGCQKQHSLCPLYSTTSFHKQCYFTSLQFQWGESNNCQVHIHLRLAPPHFYITITSDRKKKNPTTMRSMMACASESQLHNMFFSQFEGVTHNFLSNTWTFYKSVMVMSITKVDGYLLSSTWQKIDRRRHAMVLHGWGSFITVGWHGLAFWHICYHNWRLFKFSILLLLLINLSVFFHDSQKSLKCITHPVISAESECLFYV